MNGFVLIKLLFIIFFFCVKKGMKNVEIINVIFRNKKNICKKYFFWKIEIEILILVMEGRLLWKELIV